MIKHLLKIVWNRKRVNGLIISEIFFSFIVLFAVMTAVSYFSIIYKKPLGYSVDRVWRIKVDTHLPDMIMKKEKLDGMMLVHRALRDLPEIEASGGISMPPYSTSTGIWGTKYNGREVETQMNHMTDDMREVLNIELTAGRWFSRDDDASTSPPAIINQRLAGDLFGSEDPLGKEIPFAGEKGKPRVVGVVRDFRKGGEFSEMANNLISRIKPDDTTEFNWWEILVRVKPGVTAAFQERLVRTLEGVEKEWTFEVAPLEQEREANFKNYMVPIIIGGLVAGFLLLMVALGLIGVLWQNVSQRTKEIGLRRALGGTANNISWQIRGEQFAITTIGAAAGSILVMQIPFLNLVDIIDPSVYATALIVSLIVMYTLTYLCSMFPSWLAMDIQPAEALHYD